MPVTHTRMECVGVCVLQKEKTEREREREREREDGRRGTERPVTSSNQQCNASYAKAPTCWYGQCACFYVIFRRCQVRHCCGCWISKCCNAALLNKQLVFRSHADLALGVPAVGARTHAGTQAHIHTHTHTHTHVHSGVECRST